MTVWLIGFVMLGLIIALISNRVPPTLPFIGAVLIFLFGGILPSERLLMAFANETLAGLILLLLASTVLEKTYTLSWITKHLFTAKGRIANLFRMTGVALLASSHLNNTAVVAALMGAVKTNKFVTPSKFLIPLSYAAIMGGTLTLIGTSTNLIVNSFVVDAGLPSLSFYNFLCVGGPIALAGILYLVFVVPHILPDREQKSESVRGDYFLEAKVSPESKLVGRSVQVNRLRNLESLFLAEIIRGDKLISPVVPEEIIQPKDRLVFTGNVTQIQELRQFDGLTIMEKIDELVRSNLQEVVVKHNAPVIGRRIKDTNFRTRFDAVVVGVRRGTNHLPGKIGSMALLPGDSLVLAVGREFERHDNLRQNFIFIQPLEVEGFLNRRESLIAMGAFLLSVLLMALQMLSLFKAMVALMAFYVVMGYFPTKQFKRQVNLGLFIMIGSSLAIADVLRAEGIAQALGEGIIQTVGMHSPQLALLSIYIATALLTELVTNNAAAALIFPIALSTAQTLAVSPMPFIMVTAFAASASFLTPIGYQTNTMVYSLGSYRFSDYLKAGLGMAVLYAALTLLLVPYFFPF